MDRIKKLCRYLDKCKTFADIGCDHGYCTAYMFKNGLCESAVITDISAKCLKKAETLLKTQIETGAVTSFCGNGLEGVNGDTEQVLIAGMGGEEIINILRKSFIPEKFVLQPMKNLRSVREYLLGEKAEITLDEPFESGGKFYYVIKGKKSGNSNIYGEQQLEFGLNLSGEVTRRYVFSELEKCKEYLKRDLKEDTVNKLQKKIEFMEEALLL